MRLREFLERMQYLSDAVISITGLCDKYNDGPLCLMSEEFFKEHQDDKISLFSIQQTKDGKPELRIYLQDEFELDNYDLGYV